MKRRNFIKAIAVGIALPFSGIWDKLAAKNILTTISPYKYTWSTQYEHEYSGDVLTLEKLRQAIALFKRQDYYTIPPTACIERKRMAEELDDMIKHKASL